MPVTTEQAQRFREEAGLPAEWQASPTPGMPVVELTRRVLKVWQRCYPDEPIRPDNKWHFNTWVETYRELDEELSIFHIDQACRGHPELYELENAFKHEKTQTLRQFVSAIENIYLKQFTRNLELHSIMACLSVVMDSLQEAFQITRASPQDTLASLISPKQGRKLETLIWQKTSVELSFTETRMASGDEIGAFCFSFLLAVVAAVIGILLQPSYWKLILITAAIFPFFSVGVSLLFQLPKWRKPEITLENIANDIGAKACHDGDVFLYFDDLEEDLSETAE